MNILAPLSYAADIANLHLPKSLASLSGLRPTAGNVARAKRAARTRRNIRARAPKR